MASSSTAQFPGVLSRTIRLPFGIGSDSFRRSPDPTSGFLSGTGQYPQWELDPLSESSFQKTNSGAGFCSGRAHMIDMRPCSRGVRQEAGGCHNRVAIFPLVIRNLPFAAGVDQIVPLLSQFAFAFRKGSLVTMPVNSALKRCSDAGRSSTIFFTAHLS